MWYRSKDFPTLLIKNSVCYVTLTDEALKNFISDKPRHRFDEIQNKHSWFTSSMITWWIYYVITYYYMSLHYFIEYSYYIITSIGVIQLISIVYCILGPLTGSLILACGFGNQLGLVNKPNISHRFTNILKYRFWI